MVAQKIYSAKNVPNFYAITLRGWTIPVDKTSRREYLYRKE
ncbi:hypothetical protein BuS5_02761 [Desulfosarcina sp. BuS5]|nr:hypothetical protein BuS5_02761 [Desulfosarcina sp. BuS5]